MRILVYGAGVIGGCTAHCLCQTNNDITVLARGKQKEVLERDGLVAKNHFGGKTKVDRPHVIDTLSPDDRYDIIFAVMQYEQMRAILSSLAANCSGIVVLVGNNMASIEMEAYLKANSKTPKTVVFGFQGTGGERKDGHYTYVAFGKHGMSVGSTAMKDEWLPVLQQAFAGIKYRLTLQENMETWYKSHAAFVLPVCYVCYHHGCSLRGVKKAELYRAIEASLEGNLLLQHLGYPVVSEEISAFSTGRRKIYLFYWLCAHTKIGELAASNHAKNAMREMIDLNTAFSKIREHAPDFKMPAWDSLEPFMPLL